MSVKDREGMRMVAERSLGLIGGGKEVIIWIGYFGDRVADERIKGRMIRSST